MKQVFMAAVMAAFAQSVSLEKILAQVAEGGADDVKAAFGILKEESITPYQRTMNEKVDQLEQALTARKNEVDEKINNLEKERDALNANIDSLTAEKANLATDNETIKQKMSTSRLRKMRWRKTKPTSRLRMMR